MLSHRWLSPIVQIILMAHHPASGQIAGREGLQVTTGWRDSRATKAHQPAGRRDLKPAALPQAVRFSRVLTYATGFLSVTTGHSQIELRATPGCPFSTPDQALSAESKRPPHV